MFNGEIFRNKVNEKLVLVVPSSGECFIVDGTNEEVVPTRKSQCQNVVWDMITFGDLTGDEMNYVLAYTQEDDFEEVDRFDCEEEL